jgi:hypothetical protein
MISSTQAAINALGRPREYIDRHGVTHALKSMYEVSFAFQLDCLKMQWKYEPTFFDYYDAGIAKKYLPDFFLTEFDLVVELSGVVDPDKKKLKIAAVRKAGKRIIELKGDYIDQLPLSGDDRDKFNFASEYNSKLFESQLRVFREMFETRISNLV